MSSQPTLTELIDCLADPALHSGNSVEVHQTHISVVFVAGDTAYKLKKPLDLGFVDYATPERRRHFCEEEVRLNTPLAPNVYRGVRSVVPADNGWAIGPADAPDAVDWLVEMQRLHDADRFLEKLHAGALPRHWMDELGRTLAQYHRRAAPAEVGRHGSFSTVAANARDNFSQAVDQVGHTVSQTVFDAGRAATDSALEDLREIITARDMAGQTRAIHGDLRLEHVYRVDEGLVVVDCIEFNDAFRFADPVADVAFTVMDLRIRWADELAHELVDSYFADSTGAELLDFYVAYRSAVRAKVHGIAAAEPELDEQTRQRALAKSRAHWLFALSTLAPPSEKPALALIGGLPGTGKSTLARALCDQAGFTEVIDSDHVRKELAGVDPAQSMRAELDGGIYTPQWTERTYAECLRRSERALHEGRRVAVAATFRESSRREQFLHAAHAAGVCGLMLECTLPPDVAVARLRARDSDASDADVATYEHLRSQWEQLGPLAARRSSPVSAIERGEQLAEARAVLSRYGLCDTG